jgi:hypothetical protein
VKFVGISVSSIALGDAEEVQMDWQPGVAFERLNKNIDTFGLIEASEEGGP